MELLNNNANNYSNRTNAGDMSGKRNAKQALRDMGAGKKSGLFGEEEKNLKKFAKTSCQNPSGRV